MFGEDFLGLHAQCLARGLGRDERIAVAVAADPRAEPDQARHLDHRVTELVLTVDMRDCPLQMAVINLDRFEQAALKIMQSLLDFVGDGRLAAAHLVGQPEGLDLQLQRVDQVVAVELTQPRVGELVDYFEHFALMVHDRAAPRFGRMRGKHGLVTQVCKQLSQRFGLDSLFPEILQRMEKRPNPGGVTLLLHRCAAQSV